MRNGARSAWERNFWASATISVRSPGAAVRASGASKEEARPLRQASPLPSIFPPNLMTPSCRSEKGKSRTLAAPIRLKWETVAKVSRPARPVIGELPALSFPKIVSGLARIGMVTMAPDRPGAFRNAKRCALDCNTSYKRKRTRRRCDSSRKIWREGGASRLGGCAARLQRTSLRSEIP
jgi:hypothetical protein